MSITMPQQALFASLPSMVNNAIYLLSEIPGHAPGSTIRHKSWELQNL
ncbi:MAG: hypothetical protein MK165_11585 [Pirellulaceae bacterium]|nr:hypothetical protein [Pirellulaceae bacterium]